MGANSLVAEHAGLPFEGKMGVGGSMNILFRADLSKYVAHRPSVLYWVMQPGADVGGIGMGLVRMVRPWNEWLIVWGYDINPRRWWTPAMATQVARQLVGVPDLEIDLISANTWTVNNCFATHMQKAASSSWAMRPPASAVERAWVEHLDPGQLQPGVEAGGMVVKGRRR
jgi:2,4-dichlorophenol 6-monooxygenase